MKIVDETTDMQVISLAQAKNEVEDRINNEADNALFVVKYEGRIISLSGRYYKFAYKTISNVRTALTNKFGRDLAEALVENNVIEVTKVYI